MESGSSTSAILMLPAIFYLSRYIYKIWNVMWTPITDINQRSKSSEGTLKDKRLWAALRFREYYCRPRLLMVAVYVIRKISSIVNSQTRKALSVI